MATAQLQLASSRPVASVRVVGYSTPLFAERDGDEAPPTYQSLHRFGCTDSSVSRQAVVGRRCQQGGGCGRPAEGSERSLSVRFLSESAMGTTEPSRPKRTTPRDGRAAVAAPAGTARHGSLYKKGVGASRDECNVAVSGQRHRSLVRVTTLRDLAKFKKATILVSCVRAGVVC